MKHHLMSLTPRMWTLPLPPYPLNDVATPVLLTPRDMHGAPVRKTEIDFLAVMFFVARHGSAEARVRYREVDAPNFERVLRERAAR